MELSNKVAGDKLFLVAYNINPKFRLSYRMKRIYINLSLLGLDRHFVYYIVDLLKEIKGVIKC